jgi:cell division protein FtsQ
VIAGAEPARLPRRRLPRLPRLRPRTVAILAAAVVLVGGGWLWLRDSVLVAVTRVTITGVSGPDARQIRLALRAAAQSMTTLDVNSGRLKGAIASYPVVKGLRASAEFPHGLRIHVTEQIPVGSVLVGGRAMAVAADGTLLGDVGASSALPTIPASTALGVTRLTDPAQLRALQVLAAAQAPMLARVSGVTTVGSHGLVAQLRNGPAIYFGDPDRLAAKWLAAAAVLADAGSAGAQYLDVTDPDRPAAGAGSRPTTAATTNAASTVPAPATNGG